MSGAVVELAFVGRSLRHTARNVESLIIALVLPVSILLLFVYVFGPAMAAPGGAYVDFVVPGVIVLCAGYGAATTAVTVNLDATSGVIDRYRAMPIRSSALLTGHVVASVARNLASTALVVAAGVLTGFRPTAGVGGWLAAIALLLLFILAVTWLAAAVGLAAASPDVAGTLGFVLLLIPYLSTAFVPTAGMPAPVRWVAEHGPITAVVDTLRHLLVGLPPGGTAGAAVLWCGAIAAVSLAWAAHRFRRR